MYVEEIFRKGLSRKEKKLLARAETVIKVIDLLNRLEEETFFIKTIINTIDAGNIVYKVADQLGKKDVIVLLDWSGIHIMLLDQFVKRLCQIMMYFKKAELNYYTIQFLGILLRDKEHFSEIMRFLAENLPRELPDEYSVTVKGDKKIIIRRRKEKSST